jgi:4-hydroxy-3-polyprenylbenzoate decarboxylase
MPRAEQGKSAIKNGRLVVGLSGASGVAYGIRLLEALRDLGLESHLVMTKPAEMTIGYETKLTPKQVAAKADHRYGIADIGAPIASGSHPSHGMIVLPCSMGTLATIALGLANSLIARAADVALKERRPLILCVRETPFNRIHLRNMTLAADAGATIFPCIPTFYNHPQGSEEMARQFACRVLAHIGLPQPGAYVWKPEK